MVLVPRILVSVPGILVLVPRILVLIPRILVLVSRNIGLVPATKVNTNTRTTGKVAIIPPPFHSEGFGLCRNEGGTTGCLVK